MTQKHLKTLRVAYYALVTAALAVAAVLLMVACVTIYRTGDHPFTRDVVAAAFAPISLPVYICLGLVAVGVILHPLLPIEDRSDPDLTPATCKRMQRRVDLSLCPAELAEKVKKERAARLTHRLVTLGLLAIGAAVFLVYALDFDHFHQSEITGSMIAAMGVLLPCMGVPFAYGVFAAYYSRHSQKREIALLKEAPDEARIAPPEAPVKKPVGLWIARCAVIGLALGFIVGGLAKDGWVDVLTKAINICTECIGLG